MRRADLILTTRRMKKIIRHEPADLIATAEAGVSLADFQKHLAQSGQWLPIDPPDDDRATLGGIVATGIGGPHGLGFGLPRSYIIGMRVALFDGRAIKIGGNVVKNVAGYDLCKLFTGSYGTLGLISEVTFKLRPLPVETRTIVARGPLASLIDTGRRIIDEFSAVAVELLSLQMAKDLTIETNRDECALLVRFVGSTRAVITETGQALKLLREDTNHRSVRENEDGRLWHKLSAAPSQPSADLVWRVAARPSDLPWFLGEVAALERDEASHTQVRWHAGLGDGRLRIIALTPVYHREAVRALEGWRQKAENLGGSLIIEKAPIEIKNEFDSWGTLGSAAELMRRVKQRLDPENAFSAGRFFG